MASVSTSVGKLVPRRTILFLCDIQERFRSKIWRMETVVSTAQYMGGVAQHLDIPVVITEQYPKAFGHTIPDVFPNEEASKGAKIFEKKLFSMATPEVKDHLESLPQTEEGKARDIVLLTGIEAHVCVQQTCLDLIEANYEVHLIADGISSQQPYDREIALQRMQNAGAYLTTAQSAVFMLMQSAEHENFKPISKLTVEHMKKPNEFN